ncbi:MAG: hypothetical protein IJI49_05325 [Bacilli bacterium]|nr:hypothetical protein [Bacilli bacterium]
MNNNQDKNNCCDNCISNILRVILILQENAECGDSCLDTCDRGFLGQQFSMVLYNTRPIVLYTCTTGNTPLSMPISKSPTETTTSSIFRLEKLDNCCATFRVLVADTTGDVPTYTSTNSFFTINLDCLCIIRCLDDTNVSDV